MTQVDPAVAADQTDSATDRLVGADVLVVGVNYAPETTGIAPYTTGMAEHLAALGAKVTVVTGMPHYPQWQRSPGYERAVLRQEHPNGVRLMRAGHYVPPRQDALRRGLFEVSWMPAAALQDLRTPADVVIGVSPSLAALPLARWAARRRRVPWMAVVQDLRGNAAANGGVRGGGKVASVVGGVECRMLRSADLVGVIGEGFGGAVQDMGVQADRVRVLPNWAHIERSSASREQARAELGWPSERTLVVHTGNMGAKQGLENVVAAAAEADRRGADVQFVLVGDGSQREALREQAVGVERITFVDPVDEYHYPLVLAAADVLLLNERPDMLEMSLPSKLTSYLSAGRPVLAACPAGGWTATVLDDSGAAVRVAPDDAGALVDAALELAADPDECTRRATAGTAYAAQRYGAGPALTRYADAVRELL